MPRALEVFEHHYPYEVAYVKAVGSRVDAEVCRCHSFFELFGGSRHNGMDHAAPCKFFNKVHLKNMI